MTSLARIIINTLLERVQLVAVAAPLATAHIVQDSHLFLSQLYIVCAPVPLHLFRLLSPSRSLSQSPRKTMWIALIAAIVSLLLLHLVRSFRNKTAVVITLSPANHSPRALAHASSISAHATTILLALPPFPSSPSPTPSSIIYHPLNISTRSTLVFKILSQSAALCRALLQLILCNVTTIILNAPPVIPALPILLFCRPLFPAASFIIDWHNLAYTLMPHHSRLTPVAKLIETTLAPFATHHWTVSKAMATFLNQNFSINPTVLYDTPRADFVTSSHQLTPSKKPHLFKRLANLSTAIGPHHNPNSTNIVVTSTSWTPDEDFHILFRALKTLDQAFPPLILVITGRGPLRSQFETLIREAAFKNIAVWFAWLPIEDYPRLLASATLGLSLHASSSGLDLPMKLVDMLACGLPVLALRYNCIHELVKHASNGFLFDDADHLARLLRHLLIENPSMLPSLREGVRHTFTPDMQWETYWRRTALPTIPSLS